MVYSYQTGILKERFSKLALLSVTLLFAFTAAIGMFTPASAAHSTTETVRGNTVNESLGENGSEGWWFNRDQRTKTPYEFTTEKASTGNGSLYVQPIANDYDASEGNCKNPSTADQSGCNKFIAENFSWTPVADVDSISYDFLIAGNGTSADANDFYLNVYANIDDSQDNYYDCRFDYTPTTGSTTEFTNATFNATDIPTRVAKRGNRVASCPTTLAGMPANSTIRAFAISVGDTSTNDTGLAGYLDNVVIEGTHTIAYDFEANPAVKEDCKKDGWEAFGFRNQGQCVSFVNTGRDSR